MLVEDSVLRELAALRMVCIIFRRVLEVSGGPVRLLRASRHDMGCLEVWVRNLSNGFN